MGEVFGRGIDTAGNFHWHDTDDGHHVYMAQNIGMSNFEIPEKCKQCGYYYNFMCRAEQCIKDGINPEKKGGKRYIMDSNEKIDEAIEYVKWLLQEKDPEGMFSFLELRSELLSIIGYLTLLKTK